MTHLSAEPKIQACPKKKHDGLWGYTKKTSPSQASSSDFPRTPIYEPDKRRIPPYFVYTHSIHAKNETLTSCKSVCNSAGIRTPRTRPTRHKKTAPQAALGLKLLRHPVSGISRGVFYPGRKLSVTFPLLSLHHEPD